MKGLLKVVQKLISLEELNLFTIAYNLNQSYENNTVLVKVVKNDEKGNESSIVDVEEE